MIEHLTFSQLVVQLLRHKDILEEHGFYVDLLQNNNLYQDKLIIKKKIFFKNLYFCTQPYLWDIYKQFYFYKQSCHHRFTYRINLTSGLPEIFNYNNKIGPEMTNDLIPFANDIFHIIEVIHEQLIDDLNQLNLNFNGNTLCHQSEAMKF